MHIDIINVKANSLTCERLDLQCPVQSVALSSSGRFKTVSLVSGVELQKERKKSKGGGEHREVILGQFKAPSQSDCQQVYDCYLFLPMQRRNI